MADTERAAATATNPAADVSKTESSDRVSEAKAPASAEPAADTKPADAGEEKWELNGNAKDGDERRGGRSERHDRNDRNDRNDRFNDRRGGGRGRGRGRGGFQNNKRYVCLGARL
jgi:lupus La protein